MQEGTFKNIVSSVRQWVNDKIERISYVVALNINSLNLRLTNVESGKQNSSDNSLSTATKTVIGAINELNNALSGKSDTGHTHSQYLTSQDITGKQDKTDNTLNTTNKTVVGAINELYTEIGSGMTYQQALDILNNV